MITNNIEHDLRVGDLVWSLTYTSDTVFRIVSITDKRIVCKDVGGFDGLAIHLHDRNLPHSNHCPSNLFKVEGKIQ